MIKINKIKNWYGIKELINPNLINENTIIYAPNGVMKTSFADGIRDILKNENPKDVFWDISSEYSIENNGVAITETTDIKMLDAVVYSGLEINSEIFNNPNYSKLMISNTLKKEYKELIDKYKPISKRVKDIISKEIVQNKKYSEKSVKMFIDSSTEHSEINQMIKFIESLSNDLLEHDLSGIDYSELFDEKTKSIIEDPTFIEKCQIYNKIVEKKFDELIFKAGFTFDGLKALKDQLIKFHFFDAQHSILMNGIIYGQNEIEKFIEEITREVYGSEDVKIAFDQAKNIFEKKGNQKFKKMIDSHPWLLAMISNPIELQKKINNTRANPFHKELLQIKNDLIEIKDMINSIFLKANEQLTLWDDVIKKYNQRFLNKNFEVVVGNIQEAILDVNVPTIEKRLKGTGREITSKIQSRFSSGEKRTIYILNLLFEIELLRIEDKEFTLILDDIVDSFDYKNKYSMIEYLKEISQDPKIQLLILTHNFDFYRSCRITLGSKLKSKLFAYEKENKVLLIDAKSKEFENFSFISNWRSQGKTKSMISLLPFLRNIIEIKDGSSHSNYKEICHFLHYDNETEGIFLNRIDSIFDTFGVVKSVEYSRFSYFEILKSEVIKIISNTLNEDKLLDKIILGIYIRVAMDKILLKKYISINRRNPENTDSNWTQYIYELVKDDLSETEKELYNKSITIAPSFIHVNGFMYEPLVDIGVDRIVTVIRELNTYIDSM